MEKELPSPKLHLPYERGGKGGVVVIVLGGLAEQGAEGG